MKQREQSVENWMKFCFWKGAFSLLAFTLAGCQHMERGENIASDGTTDQAAFQAFVSAHKKYGATPQDWPMHEFQTTQIQPDVILAPLYPPQTLAHHVRSIRQIANGRFPVFEIETSSGRKVSFIRTGVGACNICDAVLALAGTPCRTILFVGSVGSLTASAKIGDLIVPKESVSGCGADFYLTAESFRKGNGLGQTYLADCEKTEQLLHLTSSLAASRNVDVHQDKVFSIDTLLGEYPHLSEIRSLGCDAIEMETATLFHAARVIGRKAVALLYVSDCTFQGKSFYSDGRTGADKKRKETSKRTVIPQAINAFFN